MNDKELSENLQITDLRVAVVKSKPYNYPLLKIDTNQDVYGLGEMRDGSDPRTALKYKSFLLGKNPLNVDKLYQKMKNLTGLSRYGRSGTGGRMSGGISGIEMALLDIVGKVYGIPLYQLLGGKHREDIRIYADTPAPIEPTPKNYANKAVKRKKKGFTFLKLDLGVPALRRVDKPDLLIEDHPTKQGIRHFTTCLEAVRGAVGWKLPIALDHLGSLSIPDAKQVGKALEPYKLAWLEDLLPWSDVKGYKEITETINIPTLTGEGIFSLEGFKGLIQHRAIRIIHPDVTTAGGLRETKRISDYAKKHYIPTALHCAGSPISFMASIHTAAAIENFIALEHHALDLSWWEDLVTGLPQPLIEDGYVSVPEKPGLGLDLNEEVVKEHSTSSGYFKDTKAWNEHELTKF